MFVILLVVPLSLWNTAKAFLDLYWGFEIKKEKQDLFWGESEDCWNLNKDVTLL